MTDRTVSRERTIDAPAATIFDILRDPRMHPVIDGGGTLKGAVSGPERLDEGSRFGMRMHWYAPYVIRNTVVEFAPDSLIAWRHFAGHRWRYELEPLGDDRTLVRETFDYAPSRTPRLLERLGVPEGHVPGIERTLENLARVAVERAAEEAGDIAG